MNEQSVSQQSSRLCGLLKICTTLVLIVWAFWGLQLKPHPQSIPTGREMDRNIQACAEMSKFTRPILDRADKLGPSYWGNQYFADKRAIIAKDIELGFPMSGKYGGPGRKLTSDVLVHLDDHISQNRRSIQDREVLRRFQAEYRRESFAFTNWQAKHRPCDTVQVSLAKSFKKAGWAGVGRWFAIFYLRSCLFALLFFLIKMKQRRGVLATILAEKAALPLAVLGWPYYIFVYPYNVIREIRVEAELRRLGRFFRILSREEKNVVRQVAASKEYGEWIEGYRGRYQGQFQRGLTLAILGTLFLYLFSSAFGATSQTQKARSSSYVTITIASESRAGPDQGSSLGAAQEGGTPDAFWVHTAWDIESQSAAQPALLYWMRRIKECFRQRLMMMRIDHVPLHGYEFVRAT